MENPTLKYPTRFYIIKIYLLRKMNYSARFYRAEVQYQGGFTMRLVTRSDFDGLACGALLKEAGIIDHWKFAHPKDLQDGLIEVTEDDCLANVPLLRAADFGSIIIQVSMRDWRLRVNTRGRVV